MLKLEFKDRRQPGVWLVEPVFLIGTGPKCQLRLDDGSVSETHAKIVLEGEHLYLSDLVSYKGTFVNGNKIGERFQLRSGDVVQVGEVALEIVDSQAGASTSVSSPRVRCEWSMAALGGELKGKVIPLHGTMVLGRSDKCDVVINDEHMSRRHAEINLKDGVLRIVDLSSSNGTRVNGVKVTEKVLKPGDKISFDQLVFIVAGPQNYKDAALDDDEDEATVFRVAPMPQPKANADVRPAPVMSAAPVADVKDDRIKPATGGNMGMKVAVIVLGVLAVAGVAAVLVLK